MVRELNTGVENLIAMTKHYGDEKDLERLPKLIDEYKQNCRYYVTLIGEPKLSDISEGAVVKTPAKYFDDLNKAKIFQDKLILRAVRNPSDNLWILNMSDDDVAFVLRELKEFSKTYPEYIV